MYVCVCKTVCSICVGNRISIKKCAKKDKDFLQSQLPEVLHSSSQKHFSSST